jgi:uncharacterized membrane protein HdeD (DUF308 family)
MGDAVAAAARDDERGNRWLYWLLICFGAVHGLLLALDARYPSAFLRGDRADSRMAAIEGLRHLGGWHAIVAYLGTHGNIGDYAPQAVLYLAGGKLTLVISQIGLMLLSGVCVFRLGRLCELSARASCLATALYLGSPHSLVLPHQLCSEGLFVPLVAISTWATSEAVRRSNRLALSCSGLLMGITTLIRPVILLWPVVVTLGLRRHGARAAPQVFAAAAYVPIIAWMAFVWHETGTPGMGESDHSLGLNLYYRVEAIATTMPPSETRAITTRYLAGGQHAFTALKYLSFVAHYPLPVLIYAARDAEVLLFKSGVERITVDYLADEQQTKTLQTRDGNGWRQYWDKYGAIAAIQYGWRVLGVTFLISALAAAVQVALILLAVVGAVRVVGLIRQHAAPEATKLAEFLILALPVYVLIFSQLADANQSRHRAPAEFALAILATHGIWRARSAWRARAARQQSPVATC